MTVQTVSTALTTDRVAESRDYFVKHFGARVVFDCGWYVDLRFGDGTSSLQFMEPRGEGQRPVDPAGLTVNIAVDDVDREYERLTGEGVEPVMPLEDHPWGDRGFGVRDPNGVLVYLWSEREPDEEFRRFHRK